MTTFQKEIDLLERELSHTKTNIEKIDILLSLSSKYRFLHEIKSLNLSEDAVQLAKDAGLNKSSNPIELSAWAKCMLTKGTALNKIAHFKEAMLCFKEAEAIYTQLNDESALAETLNSIAQTLASEGLFEQCKMILYRSLTIRRKIADIRGEASVLNNLGNLLITESKYQEAITLFNQSLVAWQSAGDKQGESATLNNLTKTYFHLADYSSALTTAMKCLELKQSIGDFIGEKAILQSIAVINQRLKNFDTTATILKSLLDIDKDLDPTGYADVNQCLGSLYLELKDYQNSLFYFEKVKVMYEQSEIKLDIHNLYNGMATALLNLNRLNEAKSMLLENLNRCLDLQNLQGEAETCLCLGKLFVSMRTYEGNH